MKTLSDLIKPYKNQTSVLTYVIVVINYHTMSVIVVVCYINCDFLLFRAWINITKDDSQTLFITMSFIHQMLPLYFA